MVNTSDAYKATVKNGERKFSAKAVVTLADGQVLNLVNTDITMQGVVIKEGVSSEGSFDVGAACLTELTLILKNVDEKSSPYDFSGASINLSVGLTLPDGTIEWVPKGIYDVEESNAEYPKVKIKAVNHMGRFDKDFSACAMSFPATLGQILHQACIDCNVPQKTLTFLNDAYIVQTKPENCTYRDVVAYIAQLAGCFARVDYNGALVLEWYDYDRFVEEDSLDGGNFTDYNSGNNADGGNFTDYSSGLDKDGGIFRSVQPAFCPNTLFSLKVDTDDIVITGVQIIPEDDALPAVTCGKEGYLVTIRDNPLIQSDPSTPAAVLGDKLIGFTFRPLSLSCPADPSVEAGDVMSVTDTKGNTYQTIISNLSYTIGAAETLTADGESISRRQADRFSPAAKAVAAAKQYTKKVENLATQLGQILANSLGTYQTVQVLADGSQIIYMHDQPTVEGSKVIWKLTAQAFAVSNDGGATWNSGMTADGNLVAKIIEAIRIQSPVDASVYIDLVNGDISAKTLRNSTTDSYVQIGTDGIGGKGKQSEGIYLYRDGEMKAMWSSQPELNALAGFKEWLLTKGDLWIQAADNAAGQPIRILCKRTLNGTGEINFEIDGKIPLQIVKNGAKGALLASSELTKVYFSGDAICFDSNGTEQGYIDELGWHWVNRIENKQGSAWIRFSDDGSRISFGTGGQERGSLDADGWHGVGTTG